MNWKDNMVIMAGSECSPLGQRISAAGFGADQLERMLLVATFESLKCRVAGGPHGRCREEQFEKQTPAQQATRILCELRPTGLCPVRVTSGNGPFS